MTIGSGLSNMNVNHWGNMNPQELVSSENF